MLLSISVLSGFGINRFREGVSDRAWKNVLKNGTFEEHLFFPSPNDNLPSPLFYKGRRASMPL